MERYRGLFENVDDVIREFNIAPSDLDGCEIILAVYTYEDYSGSALVVFECDGVVYEVNGGHCSCFGLEDQWDPEVTTLEEVRKRIARASWKQDIDVEVAEMLDELAISLNIATSEVGEA